MSYQYAECLDCALESALIIISIDLAIDLHVDSTNGVPSESIPLRYMNPFEKKGIVTHTIDVKTPGLQH